MKRLTATLVVAVLLLPVLPAAADYPDPQAPFVPTSRAETEQCIAEGLNEMRAARGLSQWIISTHGQDYLRKAAAAEAVPYEEIFFTDGIFSLSDLARALPESPLGTYEDRPTLYAIDTAGAWYAHWEPIDWHTVCQKALEEYEYLHNATHPFFVPNQGEEHHYVTVGTAMYSGKEGVPEDTSTWEQTAFTYVARWTVSCWGADADDGFDEWGDPCDSDGSSSGSGDTDRPSATAFADTATSVFADDIEKLASSGITKGCNPPQNDRFCPDDPVTRGQMAAFLVRALKLPTGKSTFADTKGHVFAADISALADAGITRGCNPPVNNKFCPDAPVTRGQMAAFLVRALGLPAGKAAFADTKGHVFAADISALADAGITRGCNPPVNNKFCPDDPVTRGQMAAFLVRAGLVD